MSDNIPDWMRMMIQQELDTEKEYGPAQMKLLCVNSRRFIWWMCKQYTVMSHGFLGSACNLLELYLTKKSLIPNLSPQDSKWHDIKNDLMGRAPLLISLCISLSSKMESSVDHVNLSAIQFAMATHFTEISMEEIKKQEADILSALNFRLPLLTNIEKAEMMAHEIGMTDNFYIDAIGLIMHVVDLYRPDIQERVVNVAFAIHKNPKMQRQDVTNVRLVHLIAATVAATASFTKWEGPNPVARLAFLTQCERSYIDCIKGIILYLVMEECSKAFVTLKKPPVSRKRRYVE